MTKNLDQKVRQVTRELSDELTLEFLEKTPALEYVAVPEDPLSQQSDAWFIRFERIYDGRQMGLELLGEVKLGRANPDSDVVVFDPHDAQYLGVSRIHAILRPTRDQLYLIDLGSTNGTRLNGQSIGVNMPYSVSNGDQIDLGRMEFIVHIDSRPSLVEPSAKDDWELQTRIARSILVHLKKSEIFEQALAEMAQYTHASEVTIWLINEQTGELCLEAGVGTNAVPLRLSASDSLAGKVLKTNKPIYVNRKKQGDRIKLKTDYLVDAVMYVPLILGRMPIGVMSVAHQESDNLFTDREEKIVTTIADYTAIALQNARQYESTRNGLDRRIHALNSLNFSLSHDLKHQVNSILGYGSFVMESMSSIDENLDLMEQIITTAERVNKIIDDMVLLTSLHEHTLYNFKMCDLVDIVELALRDIVEDDEDLEHRLTFQTIGKASLFEGNTAQLHRSIVSLVRYALYRSPTDTLVNVALIFQNNEIVLRVQDNGPHINEQDIDRFFDHYHLINQETRSDLRLSLELMKETIASHRGQIEIHSLGEAGTEFLIRLPVIVQTDKDPTLKRRF